MILTVVIAKRGLGKNSVPGGREDSQVPSYSSLTIVRWDMPLKYISNIFRYRIIKIDLLYNFSCLWHEINYTESLHLE